MDDIQARWWKGTMLMAALVVTLLSPLSAQRLTRRVFVSAVDESGAAVLNLTAAEFRVTEQGSKREVTRAALGTSPMRIVLLVDSSTAMGPYMTSFRAGLESFIDALPATHEVTFITTGGQIRVRTPPTTDHVKLKTETARLASEGGANAFLDTLIESDRRFLKPVPAQWPVFVIVTTDNGDQRREMPIADYNKLMTDFRGRGGTAHAVVLRGQQVGVVTDMILNLVQNTGGIFEAINTEPVLPVRLKAIAERLAGDHETMADWYEVEFSGDAKVLQPTVAVDTTREGVRLLMSTQRPPY